MPNAMAPKAPWVEVCESPHTIVMPGWVRPSCGPMTCTMPCSTSPSGCSRTPNSSAFVRSVSTWVRETGSAIGLSQSSGRDVVVLGGQRQVGTAYGAAGEPQALEGLRRGHLVDQVEVDVEEVGLALGALRTTCSSHTFSAQGPAHRHLLLDSVAR